MATFKGLPPTPVGEGVSFGMNQFMEAVRNNVQVLIDEGVIKGNIGISAPKAPEVTSLTYEGAGITIPDVGNVPVYEDVQRLAADVQKLASDVYYLFQYLDALVSQLKN